MKIKIKYKFKIKFHPVKSFAAQNGRKALFNKAK